MTVITLPMRRIFISIISSHFGTFTKYYGQGFTFAQIDLVILMERVFFLLFCRRYEFDLCIDMGDQFIHNPKQLVCVIISFTIQDKDTILLSNIVYNKVRNLVVSFHTLYTSCVLIYCLTGILVKVFVVHVPSVLLRMAIFLNWSIFLIIGTETRSET